MICNINSQLIKKVKGGLAMPKQLHIYADKKVKELGDLYGIFFEDLNHAADGGLYAELVQNRSFEFDPIDRKEYHALTAWELVEREGGKGQVTVETQMPLNDKNTHYVVLKSEIEQGSVGLCNMGYLPGMPFVEGETYLFSCYIKGDTYTQGIKIILEDENNQVCGQTQVNIQSEEWMKYEREIVASQTTTSGKLILLIEGRGEVAIDMVSLFPQHTFKNRSNGMRADIAELLADMKPKFMRFPGGCLVHDGSLNPEDRNSMYRWKNTIGSVEKRPSRRNNWGYNQTLGLGYYEYFQFCEDIGAKPMPILPGGYDPHHKRITPIEELKPWIDDALDLIEFANGDTTTKWGRLREELGHPEPFGLEYLGIGNEEVGEAFFERYPYFHQAIKEQYPDIKLINTSGPFAAGGEYERGWQSARENKSEFVDEHYYQAPEWFIANMHRYDEYDPKGPKVFLGEYASWGNTYYNAIVEAAYMIGLEKAPAVGLACYAPMLCNANYVNWSPDMIWFNNHQVYPTPNYYVQKLFMNHQGDYGLAVEGIDLKQSSEKEERKISGDFSISAGILPVTLSEIKVTDLEHQIEYNYEDCQIEEKFGECILGSIDARHYKIEAKLKVTTLDGSTKSTANCGIKLNFARKDDKNKYFWEIGGWQNQDTILGSNVAGRGSCLTQSMFEIELERSYKIELEINGDHISSKIDGQMMNQVRDAAPIVEPLYYTASIEEKTGDIILKVVNLQEEAEHIEVYLGGYTETPLKGTIYELAGYELSAVNSFEEPNHILPKEKVFDIEKNLFEYEFPKQSVTICRIAKNN